MTQLQPFLMETWTFLSWELVISIGDDVAGGFPKFVPEHDKTLKAPTNSYHNQTRECLRMPNVAYQLKKTLRSPTRSCHTEDLATRCAWYIIIGLCLYTT